MTDSNFGRLPPDLAAVIPCYNAGFRVEPVVASLCRLVHRVFVVDDGSSDGGIESLQKHPVELIQFPHNQGKGFALLAGFRAALRMPQLQCVAVVDADGQHDPRELRNLYEAFQTHGADLVIGSRTFDEAHVPWRSRFGNKLTRLLTALLLRQQIPDTQSGFRLHSRPLLERIVASVPGGRYDTEMEILVRAVREGFKVIPVPIQTIYEEGNRPSHFNKLRDSIQIYRRLLRTALRTRGQK